MKDDALGWKIVRNSEGIDLSSLDKAAVEELPGASGLADYALFVAGKLLGIIEAKKVTVNPQNVLEQAKLLCRRFQGSWKLGRITGALPLCDKW